VILAACLGLAGLAGGITFLVDQGLDRAEKWTSLIGMFVSVAVAVTGVVLAWLALRQNSAGGGDRGRVSRTGNASAAGPGSVAVSGFRGATSRTIVDRTGDATATAGGHAVTGEDH
jgi:hypothetical protein